MAEQSLALCGVLLVTEEQAFAERWVRELEQIVESDEGSPIRLRFSYARPAEVTGFLADGITQLVALDERSLGEGGLTACYQQVRNSRAEIDCFLVTDSNAPAAVDKASSRHWTSLFVA